MKAGRYPAFLCFMKFEGKIRVCRGGIPPPVAGRPGGRPLRNYRKFIKKIKPGMDRVLIYSFSEYFS